MIIIIIIIIFIIIIIIIIIIIVVIITSKRHLVKCGAMIMYRWMLPKLNKNMRLSRCQLLNKYISIKNTNPN